MPRRRPLAVEASALLYTDARSGEPRCYAGSSAESLTLGCWPPSIPPSGSGCSARSRDGAGLFRCLEA